MKTGFDWSICLRIGLLWRESPPPNIKTIRSDLNLSVKIPICGWLTQLGESRQKHSNHFFYLNERFHFIDKQSYFSDAISKNVGLVFIRERDGRWITCSLMLNMIFLSTLQSCSWINLAIINWKYFSKKTCDLGFQILWRRWIYLFGLKSLRHYNREKFEVYLFFFSKKISLKKVRKVGQSVHCFGLAHSFAQSSDHFRP